MIINSSLLHIDMSDDEFGPLTLERMKIQGCGREDCEDCNGTAEQVVYALTLAMRSGDCEVHSVYEQLALLLTNEQVARVAANLIRALSQHDPEVWAAALDKAEDIVVLRDGGFDGPG